MSSIDLNTPAMQRHRQFRFLKDKVTTAAVSLGGLSVIGTLLLIFFYLLYEVMPLFQPAHVEKLHSYQTPALQQGKSLLLGVEEQNEVGMRLTDQGTVVFWNIENGDIVRQVDLPISAGLQITSVSMAAPETRLFAVGLSNGEALLVKHHYRITYPNDKRLISPELRFPYGEQPHVVDPQGRPLEQLSMRDGEEKLTLVALVDRQQVVVSQYSKAEDFITEELVLERTSTELPRKYDNGLQTIAIDIDQHWLTLLQSSGKVEVVDLYELTNNPENAFIYMGSLSDDGAKVTQLEFLLGGISLLAGYDNSKVIQYFMARDDENRWQLTPVREFNLEGGAISGIVAEHRRKGFITIDEKGTLAIYHSTAHRQLYDKQLVDKPLQHLTLSPRANALVIETEAGIEVFGVENEHPEISWSALWNEVWYESYPEEDYIWQSSSSSNDFEPKFSLTPLAFGTLKAAFYTMLIAAPLAICGAIYTAYFMAPGMRRKVKPLIELMEALPTVILGFLAGIWLAPFVENHLPGVFSLFIFVPLAILATSFAWTMMPKKIRWMVPDGWQAAILILPIALAGWACVSLSSTMEYILFGGDMRSWLTNGPLGVSFDQRNSLIVGMAMGLAVIPTIFSIAEDAIFSVPKHLSHGSLALGASPWQTLVGVVMPTASPGIFSAMMIGMGRAVGETMIVLMATGNTPIMDANIFEGMRTLSANIAVEIPEAEVDSTHFRVLYLSAFVLFLFTFVVNTMAEIIRHRLRKSYGSL